MPSKKNVPSRKPASSPAPKPRELPPLALTLDELSQPAPEQSAPLFDLARQLWKAKPWKALTEDEIFVVVDPADGQQLFVSVLGRGGEQAGVVVYRGADAYFGLLDFTERASQLPALPDFMPDMAGAQDLMEQLAAQLSQMHFNPLELLQLSQLQLMFEARKDLTEIDEEWIARHNYKATGRGFPTFRSVVPGYLPWWMSAGEAATLRVALEQLNELIGRADFSSALFKAREVHGKTPARELFARVSKKNAKGEVSWSDERIKVAPGELLKVEIAPDEDAMERIAALPPSQDVLEMELVDMPAPLGGFDQRPCFPTLFLTGLDGQVIGMETLLCGPGPHRLPLLLDAILTTLGARKTRPRAIHFANPFLGILGFVGQTLDIEIEEVEEMPTLDPAIESLMEHLENMEGMEIPEDFDDDLDDDPEMMPRVLH